MPAKKATADVASITTLPAKDARVFEVGGKVFSVQADHLPFGTLLKYAKDDLDLVALHHLIVKLVHPDQIDEFWDALDEVGIEEGQKAIARVMESFTARPTKKP